MKYLERNLLSLEKRYPDLYRQLLSYQSDECCLLSLEQGGYDLQYNNESCSVYQHDPAASVKQFWNQVKFSNPMTLVFRGLELGYHLKAYLQAPHKNNFTVLVIEPSLAVFHCMLQSADWTQELLNGHVQWFVGLEMKTLKQCLTHLYQDTQQLCYASQIEYIDWPTNQYVRQQYYDESTQILSSVIQQAVHMLHKPDREENHFRAILNILENIESLAEEPFFDNLCGLFNGVPGVVIATGPSLTQSIPHLKKIQNKAVLFAVDSALPILLQEGIIPHFVSSLERVVATKHFFENLPSLENTYLTYLPYVFHETVKRYPGPRLLSMTTGTSFQWLLDKISSHDMGNSAATMAYQCLALLGCQTILLVGQDLAYSRESQASHADGAHPFIREFGDQEKKRMKEQQAEELVEGNNGQPILSWWAFSVMAKDFERIIKKTDTQCINAISANQGRKIQGAIRMDPEDAFNQYCSEVHEVPQKIKTVIDQPGILKMKHRRLQSLVESTLLEIDAVQKQTVEKMEEVSRFYHYNFPSLIDDECIQTYRRAYYQLSEWVSALMKEYPVFQNYFSIFMIRSHFECFSEYYRFRGMPQVHREDIDRVFNAFMKWMNTLVIWSHRSLHLLKKYQVSTYKIADRN